MALNKTYWDYDNAQSADWSGYGIKYANKQIYANPNFSWGNLDFSFPTSFRTNQKVTRLSCTSNQQIQSAETVGNCIIYNSMIWYAGNNATGSFYKDNHYSSYHAGNEGYKPVIDIDTHDFAYKMTLRLFSNGNWINVNAVDFINNYDNYDTNVYGYIDNHLQTIGNSYAFCNWYNTGDSVFAVKANYSGFRTSGYGSTHLGGHVVSGQTAWSNRSIWQLCATTAANYSNPTAPYNMYFPFEIPELNGQSWNAGSTSAPAALMTGGIYTNHAVLTYSDQRVYMPLKHILKDIIVNCGLVLLDSTDTKWISMVDDNGLCQNKLVLLSSDEAKESSIYNTRTSDNNLNPNPPAPTPGDDDMDLTVMGFSSDIGGAAKYWLLDSEPGGLFRDFFLNAPQGSSLTNNLLSCYVTALNWDWQTVLHNMVIYTNGSQEPAFTSAVQYKYIYQNNPHKVLGYFEVERPTGTFLDFSPFSTYELYVPFCGWIGLPDTVAGRTIRVYMDFDASVCSCKARVLMEANGGDTIIGEISGTFGAPCPIQVVEGGLYRQAVVNSALQIASGVAQGTYGASVGAGALAISGFSSAMNGLAGAASANNTNFSQTIGRTGDTSNLCGGHYCKIRITHPVFDEVVNNSLFGHTVGYLVNEVGKIKDFKGFTVCGNPHVHGIDCTESEKEEIKRLLEEGIIIN